MPIFEYACESCGTRFEKLISRSSADDVKCGTCGKPVKRQLSIFGVGAAKPASPCAGGACELPACAAAQGMPGGCSSCSFQ